MTDVAPIPGTRFSLRTLFVATGMCAVAFAVMVRWPNGVAALLAACVPASWLVVGLMTAANALERLQSRAVWPMQFVLAMIALLVVLAEFVILCVVVMSGVFWAFGTWNNR